MLHKKLNFLFPDYADGDWELQDDGDGAYISRWNRPEPVPTPEQLASVSEQVMAGHVFQAQRVKSLEAVRLTREKIIIRLMDIAAEYNWAGDMAGRDACRAARVKLLDMTSRADVVAASNEAELKAAIKAAYADAVGTLPPAALTAFKGMDV